MTTNDFNNMKVEEKAEFIQNICRQNCRKHIRKKWMKKQSTAGEASNYRRWKLVCNEGEERFKMERNAYKKVKENMSKKD